MVRPHRYMKQDPRTGNWLYKRAFPKDVGRINGTATYVRSFETSDPSIANRRWSVFDADYDAKVTGERALAVFRTSKDARREKFWLSVARWLAHERDHTDGQLPEIPIITLLQRTSHPFVTIRGRFLEWAEVNDPDAAAVYAMGDSRLDTLFECGLVGAYFVALESQNIAKGAKSPSPAGSSHTLDAVLDLMIAEKQRHIQSVADMRRSIKAFTAACGGEAPSVEGTTKEHMKQFREYLAKRADWGGRNRNKVRSHLSSLYNYARSLFLIESNPVEMVARFEESDSQKRKPFTDADLRAIFSSEGFLTERKPSRWWLPVLSLYIGARQGELGQLERRDIRQNDDGIWFIDITDQGEDQSTKNAGSKRPIPIPQIIIDLGFIDFVKQTKAGSIFGLLRSPTGAFPSLSNELNQMIRNAGIDDPMKVFHSFRHTTRTKARTFDIPEEAMDAICGHASVNVGRRYGEHEVGRLKELLDRIQYPITIPRWSDPS